MSVFLTPDLKPFVGGTYFPPRDSFGRPGFPTILKSIAQQVRYNVMQCISGVLTYIHRCTHCVFQCIFSSSFSPLFFFALVEG